MELSVDSAKLFLSKKRTKKRKYDHIIHELNQCPVDDIDLKKKKRKLNKQNVQNALFISNMSLEEVKKLQIGDKIDHRDSVGRFVPAIIDKKDGSNLKIHYKGWDRKWDEWSNYTKELYRFAKYKSISYRPIKTKIQLNDEIDFNPIHIRPGWRKGKIINIQIGQIQVIYDYKGKQYQSWTHYDNKHECLPLNTITKTPKKKYFKLTASSEKHRNEMYKNNIKINKKVYKININEWNSYGIIQWLNRLKNGKFNNIKYKNVKEKIKSIKLKGYELFRMNDIALRFAGFDDSKDRNIILKGIVDLMSTDTNNMDINCVSIGDIFIPEGYCDPISYEIMEDPVLVILSGHTYERQIIEKCIKNDQRDPITQQIINKKHLVPNRALKNIIQDWKRQQRSSNQ